MVSEVEIDAELIQVGDMLKVLPGATVPADGEVVWGRSEVNESMVTGKAIGIVSFIKLIFILFVYTLSTDFGAARRSTRAWSQARH